jgi:hypothetical protein
MENNVISLSTYRKNKTASEEVSRGRIPLHNSHIDGKIKGSPYLKNESKDHFGERMMRIRQSLEKINQLMLELKKNSHQNTRSDKY